jgi:uncharacterized protein
MGRTAADIAHFYEQLIPTVFAEGEKAFTPLRLVEPEYSNKTLANSLKNFFGDVTLRDVISDVCVTAVSLDTGTARFHKSNYRDLYEGRIDETLFDVALATSAAPTYFPAHNLKHSRHLIDGGICANNPAMVALVEPFRFQRKSKRGTDPVSNPRTDVVLLSVGSGDQKFMPYEADSLANAGMYGWAQHISEVMFQSQSEMVHQQAKFFLGSNYLRINPTLTFPMALDDATEFPRLAILMDIHDDDEAFFDAHFT